jgi:hypothetical protein
MCREISTQCPVCNIGWNVELVQCGSCTDPLDCSHCDSITNYVTCTDCIHADEDRMQRDLELHRGNSEVEE